MKKTLLVVWHSQSGDTRRLLDAVLRGARDPVFVDIEVNAVEALVATPDDVLRADALLLATPENFGYMSGGLKVFFERIYHPCLEHTQGRSFGLLVRAGNDGSGACNSIERITTGLRWRLVVPPVIVKGALDEEAFAACEQLGATLAAGLDAGVF